MSTAKIRRRVLNPLLFRAYTWARLPLAACAGLRVVALDESSCTVRLPGGWRTRNPFGSAYFAAQTMAAELSTGAPAMELVEEAGASVAFILREVRAVFSKRVIGPSLFTFADVAGLKAVVEKAVASGESEAYTGRVVGRTAQSNEPVAEFEITWSFKRRGAVSGG